MGRKKKKTKLALVGTGNRGSYMLSCVFCNMADVEMVLLCDKNPDRLEKISSILNEEGHPVPDMTTDYQDVLNHPDIEGIILMCGWSGRVKMAIDAMKEGKVNYDNEDDMYEKHDHPLHAEMAAIGREVGGHPGGMDWLGVRAFIEAVKNGTNTPIDAYDTALLLAIAPLSEMSVAKGGVPVEIPDFTNGKYKDREPVVQSKYCLDAIIVDKDTPIFPEKTE